jgi:hypothetical protein
MYELEAVDDEATLRHLQQGVLVPNRALPLFRAMRVSLMR